MPFLPLVPTNVYTICSLPLHFHGPTTLSTFHCPSPRSSSSSITPSSILPTADSERPATSTPAHRLVFPQLITSPHRLGAVVGNKTVPYCRSENRHVHFRSFSLSVRADWCGWTPSVSSAWFGCSVTTWDRKAGSTSSRDSPRPRPTR